MYNIIHPLANLGTFTVNHSFERQKLYEYAPAFDTYLIEPQIVQLELVKDDHRPFIRVCLEGTIVKSWKPETIGTKDTYWITDMYTWNFAKYVRDGYSDCRQVVADIKLSEDYKVIQHVDHDGSLAFYGNGEPMIRIVKNDGSPITNSMSYWSHEINGWWHEPML